MNEHKTIITTVRYVARVVLLLISVLWFFFALFSGAGEFGGGVSGILQNIPNALPWLLLFVVVYIAWKWELVGGVLIVTGGLWSMAFFNAFESLIVLFGISLPLIVLGGLFILSWYVTRKKSEY